VTSGEREVGARVAPRTAAALALLLVGLAAFAWRARAARPEEALCSADVLYHVHRVERCLGDFPHVTSVDTYSHFGREFHLHWPGGYTLLLAALGRAFGDSGLDRAALVSHLSWVPVGLGVLAAFLTMALARPLHWRRPWLLLLGLATALGGGELELFGRGALDHNAASAVGVLLLALGRVERRFSLWLGGALFLFATSPVAAGYTTLVLGLVFATELAAAIRGGPVPPLPARFTLAPAAAAAAALGLDRLLDPSPPPFAAWSVFALSLFHVAWFAILGVAMALATRFAGRPAGRAARTRNAALAVVLVAALAGALLASASEARAAWSRLTTERLHVAEELSPLGDGFRAASPWVQVLVVLLPALVALLIGALRAGATSERVFLHALLVAAVAAGLSEWRHLRDLAPVVTLAAAAAAFAAHRALAATRLFASRPRSALAALLVALVLLPPFATRAADARAGMRACDAVRSVILPEVASWLKAHTADPGPRDRPPRYGVFAAWNIGHHINVLAGRPVVVDPFNHVDTEAATRAVWMARDGRDLATALRRAGARYLVVADAGRVILSLRAHDLAAVRFASDVPGGILYREEMLGYALFRLWLHPGGGGEFAGLEPRFFTTAIQLVPIETAPGLARDVTTPAGQVYEVLP
jgi:hypothetical protein